MREELYAYAVFLKKRMENFELSKSNLYIAIMVFLNLVFILPLMLIKLWSFMSVFVGYIVFLLLIIIEKDFYAKGLLIIFSWIFFMVMPGVVLITVEYSKTGLIFLFSCSFFIALYELIFIFNICQKRYSRKNNLFKNYKAIGASGVFIAISTGRILGLCFKDTEWLAFAVIILMAIIITFIIPYFQRYLIYHMSKK